MTDQTERKWKPIESAPRDGTWILLYDDKYLPSHTSYLIARWESDAWWGQTTRSGHAIVWNDDATHWMPLHDPPKDEPA